MRFLPFLLVLGCVNGIHDPNDTGLIIKPPPGAHEGPIDLVIRNRTGASLSCQVIEVDNCPNLPDLDMLESFEPGDRWEAIDVTCTDIDIICVVDPDDRIEPPLRTWRWFVKPAVDEA